MRSQWDRRLVKDVGRTLTACLDFSKDECIISKGQDIRSHDSTDNYERLLESWDLMSLPYHSLLNTNIHFFYYFFLLLSVVRSVEERNNKIVCWCLIVSEWMWGGRRKEQLILLHLWKESFLPPPHFPSLTISLHSLLYKTRTKNPETKVLLPLKDNNSFWILQCSSFL
jgi:hypothetical protein